MLRKLPLISLIAIFFSATNMAAPYFLGSSFIITSIILICLVFIILTHNRSVYKHKKINFFYFLIFIYSTLSLLVNFSFGLTNDYIFVQYGNFLRVIMILITLNFSEILLKDYLLGIRVGIIIGCLSIIISSYFKLDLVLLSNGLSSEYQTRFSGFYLNPNYAGTILALSYNLFQQKKYRITIIETAILLTSIFFTFSYTAIVILLVGLYKKNRFLFLLAPVFSVIYIIIFWDTFNFSQSRYKKLKFLIDYLNGKGELNDLFTGRIELWTQGLLAISEKPLTGNGFGYMSSFIKTYNDVGIHNGYIEILGDFGVPIGLIILVALFNVLKPKKLVGFSISIALITGHGLIYTIPIFILLTINNLDEFFIKKI